MGDRYINNGNGNHKGNGNCNENDNGKTMAHDQRSIWYIDANNLYSDTSIKVILNTPDDSDHGYYIVCDINYTNSCKERTEQLALEPNKRKINDNLLGYRERDGGKVRSEKLFLDQNNKTENIVHCRMLKFYVKMGVKVTKNHRIIQFKQDYICRDYIQNKVLT